eukprot:COSAG02_NODE_15749_length_1144_cov_1.046890_1_plen_28_part_10
MANFNIAMMNQNWDRLGLNPFPLALPKL